MAGASIGEMNAVRKHLSAIKGGRQAAAAFPARTVGLLISDVPATTRGHRLRTHRGGGVHPGTGAR